MAITGIVGEQGEGKTTIMSFLLFIDWLKGKSIYSNYTLGIPHTKLDASFFTDRSVVESLDNVSVGIDEIHLTLDARGAMGNRKKSFLLTQARKALKESNFYWTSQFLDQCDKRLRENTKRLIMVEKVKQDGAEKFKLTFFKSRYMDFVSYKSINVSCNIIWSFNLHDTLEVLDAME